MMAAVDVVDASVPLDKLRISVDQDGRKRSAAALHIGWATNRTFARYYSPPALGSHDCTIQSLTTARETWLDRMDMLKQDLLFLLKLPHHRFWSQVVYHEDTHEAFDSYLLNAPRSYDLNTSNFTEEMRQKQNDIHRLMFLVYLRMATYKETKSCHITPTVFGTLIYDYFLFDIPKIMDLCTLFSTNNGKVLQKMVNNVFSTQPKYMDDLQNAISEIDKVYSSILERFGLISNERSDDSIRTSKLKRRPSVQLEMPSAVFLDVFLYFVDTCYTVFGFLDVYPNACRAFFIQRFPTKIASFYSMIIPFLVKELDGRRLQAEMATRFEDVLNLLGLARKSLLKTFRQIIESCCFKPLLEKDCVFDSGPCIDDYFDIMTSILSEKSFLMDYERHFPFGEDVDLFIQTGLFLDNSRISYISDGIKMLMKERCNGSVEEKLTTGIDSVKAGHPQQNGISIPRASNEVNDIATSVKLDGACSDPAISEVELDSLVSRVKELIPGHEEAFIKECLVYYNFEADTVINSILENVLPPHLQNADPQPIEQMEKKPAFDHRANVYDNDEFDVFANDSVDLSRVHKGKWRHRMKDSDEETGKENLKQVTLMLSSKYEDDDRENREDLYEDDYDDTYDEQMISVNESVTWDELLNRRPFVTPNVLRGSNVEEDQEDEASQAKVQENVSPARDEFVTNPAIERERAAQNRRNFYQQRDVRGRPKGQGQDAQVTRNRDNKERNKTFHGNHNRRAMADRKQSRGMFPM